MMENNETQTNEIPIKLLILNIVIVISIIFMVFLIYSKLNAREQNLANVISTQIIETKVFDDVELSAKSAYVYDVLGDKVLYKKNEFIQLPLASITKLMTALVAVELMPTNSRIVIQKEFLEEVGDSGLLVSESWSMKDLLDFSLVTSSNDGVRAIASFAGAYELQINDYEIGRRNFIKKMNLRANELGLKQTYFVNESGLDQENTSGGYGSAIDVANLFKYILKNNPDILEATKEPSISVTSLSLEHNATNTNTDIGIIPGLLASKTGFTEIAGGNLAIAFDASIGRPIIVVVLGSTREDRFRDVEKLVKASIKYVQE